MHALPLGNGRLGCMVPGSIEEEIITLNENSMWSGAPHDFNNPDTLTYLPKVRALLFEKKYTQAQQLAREKLSCKDTGTAFEEEKYFGCYQALADLHIHYTYTNAGNFQNYTRALDLSRATLHVSYQIDDTVFSRDAFVSKPDNVIVMKFTALKPHSISLSIQLTREKHAQVAPISDNSLLLQGQLLNEQGIKFAVLASADCHGGHISTNSDGNLIIDHADEATLYIAGHTTFNTDSYIDTCKNEISLARKKHMKLLSRITRQTINHYLTELSFLSAMTH
jgi:alpha-L-fucosidase 2